MTSSWSLSNSALDKAGTDWGIASTQPSAEGDSRSQDAIGTKASVPSNEDCGSSLTFRFLGYQNSCSTVGSLGLPPQWTVCGILLVPIAVNARSAPHTGALSYSVLKVYSVLLF